MKQIFALLAGAVCVLLTFGASTTDAKFTLQSSGFKDGATMPAMYAGNGDCGGKNITPPLAWAGVPDGTKSLAITVFDPDARQGKGFWHWVGYDIAPTVHGLVEGEKFPGSQASNEAGDAQYDGPCPPVGDTPHHYVFTIYALSKTLGSVADGPAFLTAIKGSVLGSAQLVGRYGR